MVALKPALYYAFRGGYYRGLGYKPVAVTSEKGGRRWFGRECGDNLALEGLRAVQAKYAPLLEAHENASRKLRQAQAEEERALFTKEMRDVGADQ